ncbi:MAG: MFS transporter [Candidatus Zixiibacteriota bacterium]
MLNRVRAYVIQFDRRLWIVAFAWFVSALGFSASMPFLSIYFREKLGLSTAEIGFFFAAIAVVRIVSQAVGGELSDRMGRQSLIVNSQALRGLSFAVIGIAIAYAWGFWATAFIFALNSIFGSIYMPAVNAIVSDILPAEKRLDGYAIAHTANNLGWAVGPAIGGLVAHSSYAILFYASAGFALISAATFKFALNVPQIARSADRFRLSELIAVKDDKHLAAHAGLTLLLYLVVAQLVVTVSLYTVTMVGLSEWQLGRLFTLNGLLVVLLQIPMTRLLRKQHLTTQLAAGSIMYFIGYSMFGYLIGFSYFMLAIGLVTVGEVMVSPPGMTLTSRLAPEGRTGRYMGIRGFCETAGWSLGPLWGGLLLGSFGGNATISWFVIASLALVAATGYLFLGRRLPTQINRN